MIDVLCQSRYLMISWVVFLCFLLLFFLYSREVAIRDSAVCNFSDLFQNVYSRLCSPCEIIKQCLVANAESS